MAIAALGAALPVCIARGNGQVAVALAGWLGPSGFISSIVPILLQFAFVASLGLAVLWPSARLVAIPSACLLALLIPAVPMVLALLAGGLGLLLGYRAGNRLIAPKSSQRKRPSHASALVLAKVIVATQLTLMTVTALAHATPATALEAFDHRVIGWAVHEDALRLVVLERDGRALIQMRPEVGRQFCDPGSTEAPRWWRTSLLGLMDGGSSQPPTCAELANANRPVS